MTETDKIVGAVLGMAVGDALGAPVAGWPVERVQQTFGTVTNYVDAARLPGLYTARTQQALCVLDTALEDGELDPVALAARFVRMSKMLHQKWPIYGAFRATSRGFREAVDRLADGVPWDQAGTLSAANDPAVRVVPLALWSRNRRVAQFREDVARATWLTHRDPRAVAGALALGYTLLHVVNLDTPGRFDASLFWRELVEFVHDGEKTLSKRFWPADAKLPRDAAHDLSGVLRRAEGWLGLSHQAALEQITRFSRPLGDRTVRATSPFSVASVTLALWLFAYRSDNVFDLMTLAVNLGGDTSGLGAMTGALAGALHGQPGLPRVWLDGLQNRDFLVRRAELLAQGQPLPPDALELRRVEAALTEAELPRLKAKHEPVDD